MKLVTNGNNPYLLNKSINPSWVPIKPILSGICKTDIYVAYGKIKVDKDRVLGHEFCGHILKDFGKFKSGDYVTIDPLINGDKFIGIDYDGCFSDIVYIPEENIYKLPKDMNPKLGAYIEPISASLAPMECNLDGKIAIYGKGRIPLLTQTILERLSIKSDIIYGDVGDKYDTIIETEQSETAFDNILKSLNKNGKIILKSRNPDKVNVCLYELVKNNISIETAYYYDYQKSIDFAYKNQDIFDKLLGDTYELSDYETAFEESKGDKKIFLCVD